MQLGPAGAQPNNNNFYQLSLSRESRCIAIPSKTTLSFIVDRLKGKEFQLMSSATETRGSLSSKPISPPSQQQQHQPYFTSSYLSYPVTYAVSGLIRRLTEPSIPNERPTHANTSHSLSTNMNGVYTPPRRHASPFQPPPLTPLTLRGIKKSTSPSARLLSRALAEEIRLLIPPRLQLVNDWTLAYSVEQDGTSLATLYQKCDEYGGRRSGFVLVVRDGSGGVSIFF